jgi:hypothetical protein
MRVLRQLVIKWAKKQANICHQAWLDLYPKCHLSIETSSNQNFKQITSNWKRCLRVCLESPWAASYCVVIKSIVIFHKA